MPEYKAPLQDMAFVLGELTDIDGLAALPPFTEVSRDLAEAVLDEAGKLASSVIAPLNADGDRHGVRLQEDGVVAAPGFRDAYQRYVEGGWGSLQFDPEYGGQGLPFSLAVAVQEMWHAANMSWGLCPLLSQGAVEAIAANADESLKARYLPAMVSGTWSGTMNLTEPQAGSDLAAVKARAVPEGDHFRVTGQKIFITWGDHDMADNIVHLVLARLPDAPEGVKGISLFLVPKYLLNEDGSPGERNDCRAISLEHKIGIHASPTCVMSYGDNGGAVGYLVGKPNQGLACMFTMMNNARLTVGLQGVAVAERACQQAREYCRERVQGVAPGQREAGPIVGHPDVRRMLMTMNALTEAGRALAYVGCAEVDRVHGESDPRRRARHQRRLDLLTPLVKGWCTEMAQEVTSLNVQCHGGMGFIEETGAGQLFRDARILPIYEGTNGIQAMDLVGRKTLRDRGTAMFEMLEEMDAFLAEPHLESVLGSERKALLADAVVAVADATEFLLGASDSATLPGAIAFHYLMLSATVVAAWQMGRAALSVAEDDSPFARRKRHHVHFYLEQILPRYLHHARALRFGDDTLMALPEELL
ncbi:acyl-CoA dehydrogenase [Alloalcanivorax xenomutans]|uniref:3-methylmercaptopropionyl-CoA dehydrogenase n=1 Tax=Alloalcanivorax xenomutans TaxID=1094342 RepID=A0A9Q3ZFK0_9GAMM|nr:acyl-CoA dehydrogenase [Alloalcanivorax xenomutans]ARB47414.1 acyl-CoA dehydrogenase [Alloalcanivorax xenomutans]MCE7508139.1 acyl-CoA dehydrogenase [Alloalcanivorax xenomutans]